MRYQALTLVATATLLSSSALAHPVLPRDLPDLALTARQEGITYDQGHKSDGAEKGKHGPPGSLRGRDEAGSASVDEVTAAPEKREPGFWEEVADDIPSYLPKPDYEDNEKRDPGIWEELDEIMPHGYLPRPEHEYDHAEKRDPSLLEDLEKYVEERDIKKRSFWDGGKIDWWRRGEHNADEKADKLEKKSFWDGGKIHWWRRDIPGEAEKDVVDKRDKPFWEGGGIHWW